MSTIGVLYTAYGCPEYVVPSLRPWIEAKRQSLCGHSFLICAVSVPFEGFSHEAPDHETRCILGPLASLGDVDHCIVRDKPMKETDARGLALQWLVSQGAESVVQWDADEVATLAQLERILAFWAARPHAAWARLSYRNAVFTKRQFLAQPFQPPRIHRVHLRHCVAHSFWDDNNVAYREPVTGQMYRDVEMPHVTVPPAVALVNHWSWLNDDRSRRKVAYQEKARQWQCSFAWDDARGGLIFRDGLPPPEVVTEDGPA